MKKLWRVRTTGHHPARRKDILPFATWMGPERTLLSARRQRKAYTKCAHLYVDSESIGLLETE